MSLEFRGKRRLTELDRSQFIHIANEMRKRSVVGQDQSFISASGGIKDLSFVKGHLIAVEFYFAEGSLEGVIKKGQLLVAELNGAAEKGLKTK